MVPIQEDPAVVTVATVLVVSSFDLGLMVASLELMVTVALHESGSWSLLLLISVILVVERQWIRWA